MQSEKFQVKVVCLLVSNLCNYQTLNVVMHLKIWTIMLRKLTFSVKTHFALTTISDAYYHLIFDSQCLKHKILKYL